MQVWTQWDDLNEVFLCYIFPQSLLTAHNHLSRSLSFVTFNIISFSSPPHHFHLTHAAEMEFSQCQIKRQKHIKLTQKIHTTLPVLLPSNTTILKSPKTFPTKNQKCSQYPAKEKNRVKKKWKKRGREKAKVENALPLLNPKTFWKLLCPF